MCSGTLYTVVVAVNFEQIFTFGKSILVNLFGLTFLVHFFQKRRNEEESPMVAEEEDPYDSNEDSNVEYTSELSGSSADSSQR